MTTGEKIAKFRKENNMTQEQLADLMQVSRQSVSKWESDIAFPETEKLLHLSELFHCSIDYLLKESIENDEKPKEKTISHTVQLSFFAKSYEYVSKRKLGNLPLVHINIGVDRVAKGVIAIGLRSKGIISIGLASMGVLSLGIISLGVFALGLFSLGILAFGSIVAGLIAFGGIALGAMLAIGGVAVGAYAVGGVALGHYFACGGFADAKVAFGMTSANGSVWSFCGDSLEGNGSQMLEKLREVTPKALRWLARLVAKFV